MMVRLVRWYCPQDTGFEIQDIAVGGRARYTSRPRRRHIILFLNELTVKNHFSLKSECQDQLGKDPGVICRSSYITRLQGLHFESCVWRAVSSCSSHHPQEVLLAQFSLCVHKSGIKPDSFHFICVFVNMETLSGNHQWPK